jgi:LmbE family N-acetylglucosaminyl deacetylase
MSFSISKNKLDTVTKKVLVLAAHPDDEVLGCGGAIYNLTSKKVKVYVCFFSNGVSSRNKFDSKKEIETRRESAKKSAKILKITNIYFFDFPDNSFDKISVLEFAKVIELKIKKLSPDTIFTHFGSDLNIDHQKINQATLVATRPQKNQKVKKVFFYEVPSSTEWNFNKNKNYFSPNWFVDITTSLKYKIKALKCYKNEMRNFPHPRSFKGVESLAKWRGSASGFKAAESFILARKI